LKSGSETSKSALSQQRADVEKLAYLAMRVQAERETFVEKCEGEIKQAKDELANRQREIDENEQGIKSKLCESTVKLETVTRKVDDELLPYTKKLGKLEDSIATVDKAINELEKLLKQRIDQKHSLEEKKSEVTEIIKSIYKRHDMEIERAKDFKERFERKIMVNEEYKEDLSREIEALRIKEQNYEQQLANFDSELSGISKLTKDIRTKLRQEEIELE